MNIEEKIKELVEKYDVEIVEMAGKENIRVNDNSITGDELAFLKSNKHAVIEYIKKKKKEDEEAFENGTLTAMNTIAYLLDEGEITFNQAIDYQKTLWWRIFQYDATEEYELIKKIKNEEVELTTTVGIWCSAGRFLCGWDANEDIATNLVWVKR